jgi:hypothetical protein
MESIFYFTQLFRNVQVLSFFTTHILNLFFSLFFKLGHHLLMLYLLNNLNFHFFFFFCYQNKYTNKQTQNTHKIFIIIYNFTSYHNTFLKIKIKKQI